MQAQLHALQAQLNSDDLADRENAARHYDALLAKYQALHPPINQAAAMQLRMQHLQNRLHINKQLFITGYLAWYQIPEP